jgi:ribose transport system permease protein
VTSPPTSSSEPAAATKPAPPVGSRRRPAIDLKDVGSRTSLIGIWILVIGLNALLQPEVFLQSGTFQTIFGSEYELVFLTMALTVTFVVGEFDLSIASSMGLAGTLVPLLAVEHGWPVGLAVVAALLASCAVGATNGFLVVKVGVDAIVATLGMATLVLGLTLWSTDTNAVSGLPASFTELASRDVLGLPIGFFYGLGGVLILAYLLTMTPLGRRMAFVGSSREVARLAGINVDRIRFGAYVVGGLISGLAGVLLASTLAGYDPNTSGNYLLPAFAAVFLGTAVVSPGKFNPIGAFIAVYFLQTGIVGLQLAGLTGWVSDVFYGGALVLAVSATTLIRKRATG